MKNFNMMEEGLEAPTTSGPDEDLSLPKGAATLKQQPWPNLFKNYYQPKSQPPKKLEIC
jgi:hypothetical protein